mmetsp:Transcript_12323/g.38338  ORF Transcript_12323/g.38338 Transcript_12323/m.38338 type:complete len:304 (-) Transcript_12323:1243-2154(-)
MSDAPALGSGNGRRPSALGLAGSARGACATHWLNTKTRLVRTRWSSSSRSSRISAAAAVLPPSTIASDSLARLKAPSSKSSACAGQLSPSSPSQQALTTAPGICCVARSSPAMYQVVACGSAACPNSPEREKTSSFTPALPAPAASSTTRGGGRGFGHELPSRCDDRWLISATWAGFHGSFSTATKAPMRTRSMLAASPHCRKRTSAVTAWNTRCSIDTDEDVGSVMRVMLRRLMAALAANDSSGSTLRPRPMAAKGNGAASHAFPSRVHHSSTRGAKTSPTKRAAAALKPDSAGAAKVILPL